MSSLKERRGFSSDPTRCRAGEVPASSASGRPGEHGALSVPPTTVGAHEARSYSWTMPPRTSRPMTFPSPVTEPAGRGRGGSGFGSVSWCVRSELRVGGRAARVRVPAPQHRSTLTRNKVVLLSERHQDTDPLGGYPRSPDRGRGEHVSASRRPPRAGAPSRCVALPGPGRLGVDRYRGGHPPIGIGTPSGRESTAMMLLAWGAQELGPGWSSPP